MGPREWNTGPRLTSRLGDWNGDWNEVASPDIRSEIRLDLIECEPVVIPERDWPTHWHEAIRRAFAYVKKAAHVLYLARLYGVEDEGLPVVESARRVLRDPEGLFFFPRALAENLRREQQTSSYRQRYMKTLRALTVILREDDVTTQQREILEATIEQRLRAELAATEARDMLSQIKQIRSDLERQEVERFIAFALAGS